MTNLPLDCKTQKIVRSPDEIQRVIAGLELAKEIVDPVDASGYSNWARIDAEIEVLRLAIRVHPEWWKVESWVSDRYKEVFDGAEAEATLYFQVVEVLCWLAGEPTETLHCRGTNMFYRFEGSVGLSPLQRWWLSLS